MAITIDSEVEILAKQMASQESYEEAWMVGLEIQAFGSNGISAFKHVLKTGTPASRRATAFWLSDEAEHVPAEIFLTICEDKDDEIRFYAAYGLGYVKHEAVVDKLRDIMRKDSSSEVRQTAAQSLYPAAQLNNAIKDIIDDFAFVLEHDTSPMVREEVVTSLSYFLGTMVIEKAVSLLESALHDASDVVVDQARISLSILKNEDWADKHAVL